VTFDAEAYKRTTREQWQEAAGAWHRWDPLFDRWLGAPTELMLDLAAVTDGSRVLDVAAGSGGQSVAAARRGARVLATDLSPNILVEAEAAARDAGVEISTQVADGERLGVEVGSFDAAISRLGLMYMPDKLHALREVRDALRDGGRYAAVVFAEPERNRFFSVPIAIVRRRAALPPPAPGLPGPFSSVGLADQLEAAGFRDVEVRRVEAPLRMASAAECAQMERESFGALHQMLAGLAPEAQEDAWREIAEALQEFDGPDGFSGPCELLVGVGTK
jgi:SAM-dependent methyltransferase